MIFYIPAGKYSIADNGKNRLDRAKNKADNSSLI